MPAAEFTIGGVDVGGGGGHVNGRGRVGVGGGRGRVDGEGDVGEHRRAAGIIVNIIDVEEHITTGLIRIIG